MSHSTTSNIGQFIARFTIARGLTVVEEASYFELYLHGQVKNEGFDVQSTKDKIAI